MTPKKEPIPEGIYYDAEHDNFYHAQTHGGLGEGFYVKWHNRREEFPKRAAAATD